MSNRELSNRIEYFVGCIGAFAEKYSLSNSQAYKYLKRFSEEAVDDLTKICQRNGGALA